MSDLSTGTKTYIAGHVLVCSLLSPGGSNVTEQDHGMAEQGRAVTCRGRGGSGLLNQTPTGNGPAVGLVGAQSSVAHNVHSVSCHQLIVLVSVPLPAHKQPVKIHGSILDFCVMPNVPSHAVHSS